LTLARLARAHEGHSEADRLDHERLQGIACDAYMAHIRIMRTTVNLPDHIYVEARKLAAERKTSVTALIEEGLRTVLAEARQRRPPQAGDPLPLMDGGQLREGVDLTDTSSLWEL
jgi:hypothetical protein